MGASRANERSYSEALRALVGTLDGGEVSRRLLAGALRLARARAGEVVLRAADGGERIAATRGRLRVTERRAPADWVFALRTKRRMLGELRLRGVRAKSDSLRRAVGALARAGALALDGAAAHQAALLRAERDPLTGLANHGRLWAALEHETARAERYGRAVSVVMLDVDGFKQFNDRHGHIAGDAALARAAQLVRERSRASDIAARYGGDEFALVLPETASAGARAVAEKIRASLEALHVGASGVTVSAGVASAPEDGRSAADLVRVADSRLYLAKAGGGNRVAERG
ncbi:MAG TPA: GGDEF domain-containing protein [Myxococcota bacterium]|nr:GGDEF domain-containing protein [Myxococcota bacterium]